MRTTEVKCDACGEVVDMSDSEVVTVNRGVMRKAPQCEPLDLCTQCFAQLSDAFAVHGRRWATVLVESSSRGQQ